MTEKITVVKVIDDFTVVLNIGLQAGVSEGDNFLIYYVEPEELIDPSTGEGLGHLEIIRGPGRVVHAQPKICTVRSSRRESSARIVRRPSGIIAFAMNETIEKTERIELPFDDPQIGDYAKHI